MDGSAEGIGLLAGDEGREASTLAYRGAVVEDALALVARAAPRPSTSSMRHSKATPRCRRSPARAKPLSRLWGPPAAGGQYVCHVAVAPNGSALIASCYGDGRVGAVRSGCGRSHRRPEAGCRGGASRGPVRRRRPPMLPAATPPGDGSSRRSIRTGSAVTASRTRTPATFLPRRPCRDHRPRVSTSCGSGGRAAAGSPWTTTVVLPLGTGPRHMVLHPRRGTCTWSPSTRAKCSRSRRRRMAPGASCR